MTRMFEIEESEMEVVFTCHARPCVDLRAMFAGRFRFVWDLSYFVERSDCRKVEAAWLTRIPCRGGAFIQPHGGRRLYAYASHARGGRALRRLPCTQVVQDGAGEVGVLFDVAFLEAVAQVLGARRVPQVSEAERARRQAAGRALAARFPVKSAGPATQNATEAAGRGQGATPDPGGDSTAQNAPLHQDGAGYVDPAVVGGEA